MAEDRITDPKQTINEKLTIINYSCPVESSYTVTYHHHSLHHTEETRTSATENQNALNPISTGIHFFLYEFWVQRDYFIDIKKGLWRAEDLWPVCNILIPTRVSQAVENRQMISRI